MNEGSALPGINIYYKVTITKTAWCGQKNNGTDSPETASEEHETFTYDKGDVEDYISFLLLLQPFATHSVA